jgi:hypothetical protein
MIKSIIFTLVSILAVSNAFSPGQQQQRRVVALARATTNRVVPTPLTVSMVMVGDSNSNSNDKGVQPLESVEAMENVESATTATTTEENKKQFKNLSTGQVLDLNVDIQQDMTVSPFHLEWWAYLFVAYPFILLADDVFHFLPNGSLWDVFSLKM